ncbi:MAG: cyclodeaminase/cyclohydrolase family protein [Oscillospiraceae bacterium]|nr:cyclodeaminase/cyclohydrolase family protein [Oscillospiraceae bacterium]
MQLVNKTCTEYTQLLASKAAVPGGGSASALVGALGMALGTMVGSLTVGKKKYAEVEEEIKEIMVKAEDIQKELLHLVDLDAVNFEPLANAYSIPKDDPNRDAVMEEALRTACAVPMDIMRISAKAIELQRTFADKGSVVAISDAGVGVVACKAALQGASLNVFINAKAMKDSNYASSLEAEADAILNKYCPMADEIFDSVAKRLR